ncbi:hypothetical protein J6A31_06135 [bacterium]|nr:hypothetical protein [bacterium]
MPKNHVEWCDVVPDKKLITKKFILKLNSINIWPDGNSSSNTDLIFATLEWDETNGFHWSAAWGPSRMIIPISKVTPGAVTHINSIIGNPDEKGLTIRTVIGYALLEESDETTFVLKGIKENNDECYIASSHNLDELFLILINISTTSNKTTLDINAVTAWFCEYEHFEIVQLVPEHNDITLMYTDEDLSIIDINENKLYP